jgi:wyosine [tRNA(Phe)-imidazoG37] synthetase (radical SAM superfamily)
MSKVLPLQSSIIYGPVNSKRLGKSLGINLLSTTQKICSFNCIYCHYGKTQKLTVSPLRSELAGIDEILNAIKDALISSKEFQYLTFSGNGEPMLHPDFQEIVSQTKKLRDLYRPGLPIALLSNASQLAVAFDLETLKLIDKCIFKLDTANEEVFSKINRPYPGIRVKEIIKALIVVAQTLPITMQTIFIDGEVSNYKGEVFDEWLEAIHKIKPREIQIYSSDRPVAEGSVRMLSDDELQRLAQIINKKTKIRTIPYFAQPRRY